MTAGQREVLQALQDGPEKTRDLATFILGYPWTYDRVHSVLRRLEDRELVRRLGDRPYRWELTHAGREAIQQ